MNRVDFLLLLFVLLMGCKPSGQEGAKVGDLERLANITIDSFFKRVEDGKYENAISELFEGNENINNKDSAVSSLQRKFDILNASSGRYVSRKILKKREIEDDLGIYTYMVKYEKIFYRFVFVFYNNGSSVKIYKFSFDDDIVAELENSVKLYM